MKVCIGKKGEILTENLIFIILNLIFFVIMLLFIYSKMSNGSLMEESYSKQIALLIDSARPHGDKTYLVKLNMEDAFKEAEKNGISSANVVTFTDNIVTVNINGTKGYSYSFFNDVDVLPGIGEGKESNFLILTIKEKGIKNG